MADSDSIRSRTPLSERSDAFFSAYCLLPQAVKFAFFFRIIHLRKEKGYTQVELSEKIGIIQVLISDYERDKLRPHPEVIVRFSQALEVTTDEILGVKTSPTTGTKPSLKTLRRLKKIENLPLSQQKVLFKTIDNFLKGAEKK